MFQERTLKHMKDKQMKKSQFSTGGVKEAGDDLNQYMSCIFYICYILYTTDLKS